MERICQKNDCGRSTYVIFDGLAWCHGHFLERVADSDADRERARAALAEVPKLQTDEARA